jgi:hypothetical protein
MKVKRQIKKLKQHMAYWQVRVAKERRAAMDWRIERAIDICKLEDRVKAIERRQEDKTKVDAGQC